MGRLDSGLSDLPPTGVFETWPPHGFWNTAVELNTELLPFVILSYEGNFLPCFSHIHLQLILSIYLDRIALSSDCRFRSFSFKESRPSPPSHLQRRSSGEARLNKVPRPPAPITTQQPVGYCLATRASSTCILRRAPILLSSTHPIKQQLWVPRIIPIKTIDIYHFDSGSIQS